MIKAKYTVVLKTLLDDPAAKAAIDRALSTYPLYKPDRHYDIIPDRETLNRKLLNHYKYREIGFETVGRFLDELENTMVEIMPRYNELLKTVETMANLPSPFDNVDVVETFEQKTTNESISDTTTESTAVTEAKDKTQTTSKDVESNTPADTLTITAKEIDAIPYADRASWAKSNTESDGDTTATSEGSSSVTNETTGTTTHTYTKKGNQGVNTYAHDMNEFRTSIIDVVQQIIEDPMIIDLFMLVY